MSTKFHVSSNGIELSSGASNEHSVQVTPSGIVVATTMEWHVVGSAGEPAYQNGWTQNAAEPLRFGVDIAGNVHVQGRADKGNDNSVVFQLPAGFRPSMLLRTQTLSSAAFDLVAVIIDVNGEVRANWNNGNGTSVNLTLPPFSSY